ncbi:MAG: hypothetical protein J6T22_03230 [Bacteroidales bacterium]|nr:hypothetical protein [Bacteroidales bacterium]
MVGSSFRGHGFGRALIEHIFGGARHGLAPVDPNLTSRRDGSRRMRCIRSWV